MFNVNQFNNNDIWRRTEVIKTIQRKATSVAETSIEEKNIKGFIFMKFTTVVLIIDYYHQQGN